MDTEHGKKCVRRGIRGTSEKMTYEDVIRGSVFIKSVEDYFACAFQRDSKSTKYFYSSIEAYRNSVKYISDHSNDVDILAGTKKV